MISAEDYDDVVASLHLAGAGSVRWDVTLNKVAKALRLWAIQIIGIDKRRGSLMYSLEGGPFDPQVAVDYIRDNHPCNPRIEVVKNLPLGQWMHCHEHFNDHFVATNRLYQDFLIPYGGRYMSGTKLIDNESSVVLLGAHRGVQDPPLGSSEVSFIDRLRNHLIRALDLHNEVRGKQVEFEVGQMIVQRLNQPVALVDATKGIRYLNQAAKEFEKRSTVIEFDGSTFKCADQNSDIRLLDGLRRLLNPQHKESDSSAVVIRLSSPSSESKTFLTMKKVDPDRTLQAFGNIPIAFISFHETGSTKKIDPVWVAEVYDLSPAEARVAVALAEGKNPKEIAEARCVALSTIKSQIKMAYLKMGIRSQVDLVRSLLALPQI